MEAPPHCGKRSALQGLVQYDAYIAVRPYPPYRAFGKLPPVVHAHALARQHLDAIDLDALPGHIDDPAVLVALECVDQHWQSNLEATIGSTFVGADEDLL